MKLFKTNQIKALDAYTIEHEPISSFDLMKRASSVICDELLHLIEYDKKIIFFAGVGNNGGDAFVTAFYLSLTGSDVIVYFISPTDKFSADLLEARKLYESKNLPLVEIKTQNDLQKIKFPEDCFIIDGLFGSGLNRPIEGLFADVVSIINNSKKSIVSIDIPSGLFGEDNSKNIVNNIVCADITLTLQFPKLAFMFAENEKFVGDVHVLDIKLHPRGIEEIPSDYFLLNECDIQPLRKQRKKFSHKGTYGHALLIAGSYGMMGASILASKACLRSGCGLLTTHIPKRCCDILQISVPEAIASLDECETHFSELPQLKYSAVGVGPGLGTNKESQDALLNLLESVNVPLVIDADALNIIAKNNWLKKIPENSIITPHPKEFDRLVGVSKCGYERFEKQRELSLKYKIVIVLKGANTSISLPSGICYFNSTGNPGMATAGSGDVLTGVILSYLAQGYTSEEAAILGVYSHGKAGDEASKIRSQESIIASDIIEQLR